MIPLKLSLLWMREFANDGRKEGGYGVFSHELTDGCERHTLFHNTVRREILNEFQSYKDHKISPRQSISIGEISYKQQVYLYSH
jgi:hypothetical protein